MVKLNSITLPDVNVGNVSDVYSRLIEKREDLQIYTFVDSSRKDSSSRTHARTEECFRD